MKSLLLTAAGTGLVLGGLVLGGAATLAQTDGQTAGQAADQPATQAPSSQAGKTAADYTIDTPVAKVGGEPITVGQLVALRRELPRKYQQLPDKVLYNGLVEQLIDQKLLSDAARKAGLDKQPAVALHVLNQKRAILSDAYLRSQIKKRVTQDKIEALYKERYVNAKPVEEVHARHILVKDKKTAEEIEKKLKNGADFAALAKQYGTDGTKSRGGDLGWFTHDEMVPAFADAVFAMKTGTISKPVKTDFGWHVIKLEGRRQRPVPPLDQVRSKLMQEAAREAQKAAIKDLRAQAKIVMPDTPPPAEAIRADQKLENAN